MQGNIRLSTLEKSGWRQIGLVLWRCGRAYRKVQTLVERMLDRRNLAVCVEARMPQIYTRGVSIRLLPLVSRHLDGPKWAKARAPNEATPNVKLRGVFPHRQQKAVAQNYATAFSTLFFIRLRRHLWGRAWDAGVRAFRLSSAPAFRRPKRELPERELPMRATWLQGSRRARGSGRTGRWRQQRQQEQ